jgi:hypothetical protein
MSSCSTALVLKQFKRSEFLAVHARPAACIHHTSKHLELHTAHYLQERCSHVVCAWSVTVLFDSVGQ